MKKYLYTGTQSMNFTLPDGNEIYISYGDEVELPSENQHVSGLVATGYLTELQIKKTK